MSESITSVGSCLPAANGDSTGTHPPQALLAALAMVAAALAQDAATCGHLLNDGIDDAKSDVEGARLAALVPLVARMGWFAEQMYRAALKKRGGVDDDIGWFTASHEPLGDAVRALRSVVPAAPAVIERGAA